MFALTPPLPRTPSPMHLLHVRYMLMNAAFGTLRYKYISCCLYGLLARKQRCYTRFMKWKWMSLLTGDFVLVLFSTDSSQDTGAARASRFMRSLRISAVTSMSCCNWRHLKQPRHGRENGVPCDFSLIYPMWCVILHIYLTSVNRENWKR